MLDNLHITVRKGIYEVKQDSPNQKLVPVSQKVDPPVFLSLPLLSVYLNGEKQVSRQCR